jgi:hypothetical protein
MHPVMEIAFGSPDLELPAEPSQDEGNQLVWSEVGAVCLQHSGRKPPVEVVAALVHAELPHRVREVVGEQVEAALLPVHEPDDPPPGG